MVLVLMISLPVIYSFTSTYLKSAQKEYVSNENITVSGQQLFQKNCAACHGIDMLGNPPVFPSLIGVNERMKKSEILELLQTGRNVMPSMPVRATCLRLTT